MVKALISLPISFHSFHILRRDTYISIEWQLITVDKFFYKVNNRETVTIFFDNIQQCCSCACFPTFTHYVKDMTKYIVSQEVLNPLNASVALI